MRELSPFNLGPVETTLHLVYDTMPRESLNMENAWQFSKVYKKHVGPDGWPTPEYFEWAAAGFNDPVARRFPMGKGVRPEYSLYVNPETTEVQRLGYVDARKKIYLPLYRNYVTRTAGYQELKRLVASTDATVYLRDFDGYNAGTKTFQEILDDPNRKMGHAFILADLLNEDD